MMVTTDIVSLFAPGIAPYISTLLNEGRVGICRGGARIAEAFTGTTEMADTSFDRFKVVIPHAGCSVTWEVMFSSLYPESPPDFIFAEHEQGFVPDVDKLKSLVNWQPDDPRCLLHVIEELLAEYSLYQRELLEKSSRLQFEFSSLLEHSYTEKDIEIHITKNVYNGLGPVNFLIKLPIDFSRIPAYMNKDNPGEDTAVLLVTFQSPEDSKLSPQLYLSPRVEHVLGGSASLRIPAFPAGGCLIDYVPSVCELLKNKIDQVVQGYEKRKECISAFLSLFGRSVVEYDAEAFTNASFLMEWHDFFFGLTVELPKTFPKESPLYHFHSVYHEAENGQPYNKVIKDPPFSPRWSFSEMAERARAYILDYIVTFQKGSVTEGSFRQ